MATKLTYTAIAAMTTGTGLCTAMDGAYLQLYSGAVPTNAYDAATGTKLWEKTLNSPVESSLTDNVLTINVSGISANGLAGAGAGTVATYARLVRASDSETLQQMTVGASGSGADIIIDSTTIVSGAACSVTSWTMTFPIA